MANILVHAVGATAGGGATYLRHFLSRLPDVGLAHDWHVLVAQDVAVPDVAGAPNVRIDRVPDSGLLGRVAFDQIGLRRLVAEGQIDLILATGNFGTIAPPVPQILLNRNPLYFSREHLVRLRQRGEIRELANIVLRRQMAIASIRSSVVNVTPTAAFGEIIRASAPNVDFATFRAIYHGFDRPTFLRKTELAEEHRSRLSRRPGVKRILMVSHFNYFRNFETLLRGFARLRTMVDSPLELVLTTKLGIGVKDHRYDTTAAAQLMAELEIGDSVTMLGTVAHSDLHPLYRAADAVVCPAYLESFGHPMVEAMASGRPIVAADLPIPREICQDAAVYFPTFEPEMLAARLHDVLEQPRLADRLATAGLERSTAFSWDRHFRELLETIDEVVEVKGAATDRRPVLARAA